jgi:lysozyme family protein
MSAAQDAWLAFLLPSEGSVLNVDPADPGNWTSGVEGIGKLLGSKYGISAASYPTLDIFNLTAAAAREIQINNYWRPVFADSLPPPLAFLVADAAYMSGPKTAARQLQAMVGTAQDGAIGPITLAALKAQIGRIGMTEVLAEWSARRVLFEAGLPIWGAERGGWVRRVMRGLLIAKALDVPALAVSGPAVA